MTQQPQQQTHEAPKQQTKPAQGKSTTEPIRVWTIPEDDAIVLRIDAKDPQRPKIFEAVAEMLGAEHRDAEQSQVRAMAQVPMPAAAPRPNPA